MRESHQISRDYSRGGHSYSSETAELEDREMLAVHLSKKSIPFLRINRLISARFAGHSDHSACPSRPALSALGGRESTGSSRRFAGGITQEGKTLEQPVTTRAFSIWKAFGSTGWWDSSGRILERQLERRNTRFSGLAHRNHNQDLVDRACLCYKTTCPRFRTVGARVGSL